MEAHDCTHIGTGDTGYATYMCDICVQGLMSFVIMARHVIGIVTVMGCMAV